MGIKTHKDNTFAAIGNVTYTLGGGEDYQAGVPALGGNGGMKADLGDHNDII